MEDTSDRSHADAGPVDDSPTITCRRCDREWDLEDELSAVGNQAFEQFALDHRRHTGHFPDGIETWRVSCRHCPEEAERLEETAARRWAETHARHTRHTVALVHSSLEEPRLIEA
jgi:hypothetical protein